MADMTGRRQQADRFIADAGWAGSTSTLLAGDASNRRYDRLTDAHGDTAILMDAPPERGEDVRPFVRMARHLTALGLNAPEIYHEDAVNGFLLIEDLGDDLFARLMASDPDLQRPLYRAATDVLVALHKAPNLPLAVCDAAWLTGMTDLVFDWYAPDDGGTAQQKFAAVFRPLAQRLDDVPKVVILRDYHAENLLWLADRDGVARVGLLDFQDALLGHPAYDLVSVLQDARRDVPPDIEAEMIDRYIAQTDQDKESFLSAYALLGAQRNLRIIGIFARLCLRDGKAHYIDKIPRVWGYAMRNLRHPSLAPVAEIIRSALPEPTPDHLEKLKRRCATIQQP